MATKIIEGWIDKRVSVHDLEKCLREPEYFLTLGRHGDPCVYEKRGHDSEWSPEACPPKKIKITVEIED